MRANNAKLKGSGRMWQTEGKWRVCPPVAQACDSITTEIAHDNLSQPNY